MNLSSRASARILFLGALGLSTCFSPEAFCDTISLTTTAPTVGYGPAFLGGGPYFTYTGAPNTALTVSGTTLLLNTGTANLGDYTYNSGHLSADALSLALSVTPTVNGTTALTPLVFNGTLTTGAHTIFQPVPYLIDFDPGLNPSAQVIMNGSLEFVALPFAGYLFGVDVLNFLSYPAYDNANVALLTGIIAPQSQVPEPATLWITNFGVVFLIALWGLGRRRNSAGCSGSPQV